VRTIGGVLPATPATPAATPPIQPVLDDSLPDAAVAFFLAAHCCNLSKAIP